MKYILVLVGALMGTAHIFPFWGTKPAKSDDDSSDLSRLTQRDEKLTAEQRRAFFARKPEQTISYKNVEEVAFCELVLPGVAFVPNLLTMMVEKKDRSSNTSGSEDEADKYEERKIPLGVIFDDTIQGKAEFGRDVHHSTIHAIMHRQDSYGNTVLHKFAYLVDVDEDLYSELSQENRDKITSAELAKRLKVFANLGADFKLKNNAGRAPIDMFRSPDSVGAQCFKKAMDDLAKKEAEDKQKKAIGDAIFASTKK